MNSYQMTKPFLVVRLILFFSLVVITTIPDTALASLDTSNQSRSNSFPFLELQQQREPQSDLNRTIVENLLPSLSSRHRDLNLSEQITLQDSQKTVFSPFEFTLSLDQRSANIVAGESARSTIIVTLESGNAQSVSLSCNLSPSSGGTTCNISPL